MNSNRWRLPHLHTPGREHLIATAFDIHRPISRFRNPSPVFCRRDALVHFGPFQSIPSWLVHPPYTLAANSVDDIPSQRGVMRISKKSLFVTELTGSLETNLLSRTKRHSVQKSSRSPRYPYVLEWHPALRAPVSAKRGGIRR